MKYNVRFLIIGGLVAACLAAQGLLFAHLKTGPQLEPGSLRQKLADFPRQLGSWVGEDVPMSDEEQYASDHFKCQYVSREFRQAVLLWMVFSDVGEDRKHFPEICLTTHGMTEDLSGNDLVEVDGHPSPIQQHRFRNEEYSQLVYYWHYSIPPEEVEGLTTLQRAYQEIRNRRASITLQVFVPEGGDNTREAALDFVKLVDGEIQDFVGADAIRGFVRRPVTLIEE